MDYLINFFSSISGLFVRFFSMVKIFFQTIIDFINFLVSILSTLFFGLKTLLSGTWSLIQDVFTGSLFDYLFQGFNTLSHFIGLGGAIFVSSIFFVVVIRIIIAFVFKIFRLNIDYKKVSKT